MPDNRDVVFGSDTSRPLRALWFALSLIGIDQRETFYGRGSRPPQLRKSAYCHFYAVERIASAGPQFLDYEVNSQACVSKHVLKEACIADLRRAFAAYIDQTPLRDGGGTAGHPRCGIPPYAPLRYLR